MGIAPEPGNDLVATDRAFMRHALALAEQARDKGEVPVGAVLVLDGSIAGTGHNLPIASNDPTAHAEILALRSAAATRGSYRLPGSTLYVTLEPCAMCAGAIVHARVQRLVIGAPDPKTGAAGSVFDLVRAEALNHSVEVCTGVLEAECGAILREFFAARR